MSNLYQKYDFTQLKSAPAGENIAKGLVVFMTASDNLNIADVASNAALTSTDYPAGIAMHDADDGEILTFCAEFGAEVHALAGDTVTKGIPLMVESGGRVVPWAQTTQTYTNLVGYSLEGGSDGQLILIRFAPAPTFFQSGT